jgi:branched-chain amino acid transport system substrate-binding protein
MFKTKWLLMLLALVAVLALGTACASAPAGPIKLGMVTSTSGANALLGQSGVDGAKVAVDELNAAGGVLGRKIELIVRDDQGLTDVGAREVRDLILSQKVDAMFGGVSSGVLLAESPIVKDNKMVFISFIANTERAYWEQGHRYIFSLVPNTQIEGAGVATYTAKLPYKKWVVIGPDYEFGHIQSDAWAAKMKELKSDFVVTKSLFPKLGEKDYTSFITAALAEQPEAVYANIFGADIVAFTKQAKNYGFFDKVKFVGLYDVDSLQALGQDVVTGVIGYERAPYYAIQKLTPSKKLDDFVATYQKQTNKLPSCWAVNGYDAIMAWAKAAKQANSVDSEKVVDALEGLKLDSLRGPNVYIDKFRHQANVGPYIGVIQWDPSIKEFAVFKDPTYVAADTVWRSEADIKAIRQKAGNTYNAQ